MKQSENSTPRDPETWSGGFAGRPKFDRGFTGHEHLYGFGLINMNGRMYDPVMSSFLSPDNYVQAPDFSQSFNRYAYCLNNPLKYVDPDGEFWHIVIGAAIGGTVNVLANLKAIDGDFGKGAAYFGIGALAGALGAYVGGVVAGAVKFGGVMGGSLSGAAGGASSGFVTGAGNAWMGGAGFGQGLLSGLKSSAVGAGAGAFLGGLSRGVIDYRNGYSFWDGSVIDEFVSGGTVIDPVSNKYNSSFEAEMNDQLLSDRMMDEFGVKKGDFGIKEITTKVNGNYRVTTDGRYVNIEKGYEVGGYTKSYTSGVSEVHVSPKITSANAVDFRAIAGHELIHAYHHYAIPNFSKVFSERVAYRYTYDTYVANGQFSKATSVFVQAAFSYDGAFWGAYPNEYLIPFVLKLGH